jgi:hypothetical protein
MYPVVIFRQLVLAKVLMFRLYGPGETAAHTLQ